MRKPNESLDDYVVKALPERTAEPPVPVSLRFTGEVEVLKPLARWDRPVKLIPSSIVDVELRSGPHRLSWFHRSLVMGGSLALAALVLTSAIVIGISDQVPQYELAQVGNVEDQSEGISALREDPLAADIFPSPTSEVSSENPTSASDLRIPRSTLRRVVSSAPMRHSYVRARKQMPDSRHYVSQFIPTTHVIYIENGLIKSRIEPWLSDRK